MYVCAYVSNMSAGLQAISGFYVHQQQYTLKHFVGYYEQTALRIRAVYTNLTFIMYTYESMYLHTNTNNWMHNSSYTVWIEYNLLDDRFSATQSCTLYTLLPIEYFYVILQLFHQLVGQIF